MADAVAAGRDDVHVIGFGGCYPSAYAQRMLEQLCTHPNVGAVALVSLGCEGFDREQLAEVVASSVVGTICGGSDGTSGIAANPVVGRVFDRLVDAGGTAVFEETGELIGCEQHIVVTAGGCRGRAAGRL